MDFSELQAYRTVCEEGKISLAAEKLFMSKQTLSMIIKRIENEIGVQLLIRTGTGIEMTREGECFLEYAKKLLDMWEECTDAIAHVREGSMKKLNVGFAYMSWNLWTKERAARFAAENPDIGLNAGSRLSRELLDQLDKGQLDAAVTCMQTSRYEQYDVQVICETQIEIQMTKDDPLAKKERLTIADLNGRKLSYPDSGAGFLADFCAFLKKKGVHAQQALMPAGNFLHHIMFMREEGALKLSNSLYCRIQPQVEGIVSRPLICEGDESVPGISLCALLPCAQVPRKEMLRFIEFLREEVRQIC
ncbi:MAG: LysR family transcriptional regulator [Clostridia bacterium]|nr:LysR family transcriptional regulator [Clostridia bacterium]